jgi:hypothetical protein
MASTLVIVGLILLILVAVVFAFSGLSNGVSYIGDKISGAFPSGDSSASQDPVMLTGGARKWFRGKNMTRNQATCAFVAVVSALIYSLYRTIVQFM